MMVNPPPHRDDDDDFHHAASLLELALSYWQSRRLARRYVRQGVHPSVAASRAVDSMMMLSALGVVIILWGILAFPVWLIPFVSGFKSPSQAVAWLITVIDDFVIFGVPFMATMVYVQVAPERRTNWQRIITNPVILIGSLLAIWPLKIGEIIFLSWLFG